MSMTEILGDDEIVTIYNSNGHDGIVFGLLARWTLNEKSKGAVAGIDTFYVDSTEASITSTFLSLSVPSHSNGDALVAMICPGGNATGTLRM